MKKKVLSALILVSASAVAFSQDGPPVITLMKSEVVNYQDLVPSPAPTKPAPPNNDKEEDPFGLFNRRPLRAGEVRSHANDRAEFASILDGLERYQTAQNIQLTERRFTGVIRPVSRMVLDQKWKVPGNLEGVNGWSSSLYKTAGLVAEPFLARQDNTWASPQTWWRRYPTGTRFADVLRNKEGKVFEVRIADRHEDRWDRFVAYSDKEAQPAGYVRPASKDCKVCHDQAGTAAYGGAAIPGAHTIISDPIPIIEAGRSFQD